MDFLTTFLINFGALMAVVLGVVILWGLWQWFKALVTARERTRIERLENWRSIWQPRLEKMEKEAQNLKGESK